MLTRQTAGSALYFISFLEAFVFTATATSTLLLPHIIASNITCLAHVQNAVTIMCVFIFTYMCMFVYICACLYVYAYLCECIFLPHQCRHRQCCMQLHTTHSVVFINKIIVIVALVVYLLFSLLLFLLFNATHFSAIITHTLVSHTYVYS